MRLPGTCLVPLNCLFSTTASTFLTSYPVHIAANNRVDLCEAAGFPSAAPIVGMVGRARPLKGQDIFLQMAGQLAATVPDCRFLVVGGDPFQVDDDYEARLMAMCSQLGLDDRVHWTGQLEDVRPALEAMDIFVNPGAPEGFGLVNVEAMAMGKPVVAFAHGPCRKSLRMKRPGFSFHPVMCPLSPSPSPVSCRNRRSRGAWAGKGGGA